MLILIASLLIILAIMFFILAFYKREKYYMRDSAETFTVFGGICTFLCICSIVAICIISSKIATSFTIDEQISMYEEQNIQIENELDRLVTNYMEFESNTYKDLKVDESAITLINLFPELKSDELVKEQINVYLNNNRKIIELKNKKIDIGKLRWVLYFGKV